ncbi:MAG: hypothetical protein IKB01_13350 [Lachnospiraceae bacterium]|nr:hypothetical protein [Lachnospiraceae bacterium]
MKCYTQVYVINSIEAVETYCRAFDAKVSFEIKNADKTEYEHCELTVNGEPILAVSETPEFYDVSVIHQMKLQTMTFNAFELGSVDAVKNAYNVLSEGGVVVEPIHEVPWSKCCATVIDKYGVCWWIAI